MKKIYKTILTAVVLTALIGCSPTINIKPVDSAKYKISEICIKKNEKVIVPEFVEILEQGINRHGIKTNLVPEISSECDYWLDYVATQRWDIVTFMSDAHLDLYKGNLLIASADRKNPSGLFGFGGMNPSKWNSTRSKVDPLIDELLKGTIK
jgi:hypothetical protein